MSDIQTNLEDKMSKWQEVGEKLDVSINTPAGQTSEGFVFIQTWDKKTRMIRSAKWWVAMWVLAGVTVFIPVLHFILVPAFFSLGPVVGIWTYRQSKAVMGGQGNCPKCGKELVIEPSKASWPLKDLCTDCRSQVFISQKMGQT